MPQPSRYLHIGGWSVRNTLTFHPGEGTASLNLADIKYELEGPIQFDSIANHKDCTEVFKILSERRNSKKRWEAIVVWLTPGADGSAIKLYLLTLVKMDNPKYSEKNIYKRVGSISALTLKRMPKKRRRAASKAQRQQRPRPTMKWAAKMLAKSEQASREAARAHREFMEKLSGSNRAKSESLTCYRGEDEAKESVPDAAHSIH